MWLEVASKILSESLLSLYPVFVKNINLPLHLQLWSRFITYIIISGFFVNWGFIAEALFSKKGLLLSLVTILHVYVSYRGFQLLESGVAYALFYTYPLIILLLAKTSLQPIMFLTVIGIILLCIPTINIQEREKEKKEQKEEKEPFETSSLFPLEGYLMIGLAAFTEAIIYFIVRSIKTKNSWNHLFLSYFIGTFFFSFLGLKEISNITITSTLSISLFINSIIGLCGYLLRFYSATRLSPAIYAPLSYVGIIIAYVYGFLFNGEQITIQKIIGTFCIIVSVLNIG